MLIKRVLNSWCVRKIARCSIYLSYNADGVCAFVDVSILSPCNFCVQTSCTESGVRLVRQKVHQFEITKKLQICGNLILDAKFKI